MKVAELLEKRRQNWIELERLTAQKDKGMSVWVFLLVIIFVPICLWPIVLPIVFLLRYRSRKPETSEDARRFTFLYRAACADLALADAYQLPPNTVQYLHRLVGRSHNQLYKSRRFDILEWVRVLLFEVPPKIFHDRCVQLMFCLFWGAFILSAFLAYSRADFADQLVGEAGLKQMEENFSDPLGSSARGSMQSQMNFIMAGFYIQHNTSIGLRCFVTGLLFIPGLFTTLYNAAVLGASFGHMARPETGAAGLHFCEFVTAHGPFELTAIVLSAGAGIRLGLGWLHTKGMTRFASLKKTARETMPIMGAAMAMFFFAALIEGFISPTNLPYWLKGIIAILSSGSLMFYFLVLGFPQTNEPLR